MGDLSPGLYHLNYLIRRITLCAFGMPTGSHWIAVRLKKGYADMKNFAMHT